MLLKRFPIFLILLCLFCSPALATETTLDAVADVRLDGNDPTANENSLGLKVKDGTSGTTFDRSSVIQFNAASISATDTCTTAVLKLTPSNNVSSSTIYVYKMLRTDWAEGQATWNIYKTASNWTTAGARSDTNDLTGTYGTSTGALASFTGATTADSQISFTDIDLCSYIEGEFGNTNTIFLVLHETTTGNKDYRFYDDENGTASNRPDLVVTHSAGGVDTDNTTLYDVDLYDVDINK